MSPSVLKWNNRCRDSSTQVALCTFLLCPFTWWQHISQKFNLCFQIIPDWHWLAKSNENCTIDARPVVDTPSLERQTTLMQTNYLSPWTPIVLKEDKLFYFTFYLLSCKITWKMSSPHTPRLCASCQCSNDVTVPRSHFGDRVTLSIFFMPVSSTKCMHLPTLFFSNVELLQGLCRATDHVGLHVCAVLC